VKCRFLEAAFRSGGMVRPVSERCERGNAMARATRSFRLTLSPAGMDLLIDAHCHVIRATRCLLSWGATLHIAVCYFATLSHERVSADLRALARSGLIGSELHHVGAPAGLAAVAADIARRARGQGAHGPSTLLGDVYVAALQAAAAAAPEILAAVRFDMIERGLCNAKFRP
jgi:hypothetical protein